MPGAGEPVVVHVQADVAEAVDHERVRHHRVVLLARLRQLDALERVGVERVARVGELRAGGQVRGDRREDVAPVEGGRHRLEPVRRAGDVHGDLHLRRTAPRRG